MGTDIHGYIEYKKGDKFESWSGRLPLPRNYTLFGLIKDESKGLSKRGLLDDMQFEAYRDWTMPLDGVEMTPDDFDSFMMASIDASFDKNPDWHSPSWMNLQEYRDLMSDLEIDMQKLTLDSKNHLEEFKKYAKSSGLYDNLNDKGKEAFNELMSTKKHEIPSEYKVVLATMEELEHLGHETRFIFWFDN